MGKLIKNIFGYFEEPMFIEASSFEVIKYDTNNDYVRFSYIFDKYGIPFMYQKIYFRFWNDSNCASEYINNTPFRVYSNTNETNESNKHVDEGHILLNYDLPNLKVITCRCKSTKFSEKQINDFYEELYEKGFLKGYLQAYTEMIYDLSEDNILKKINKNL